MIKDNMVFDIGTTGRGEDKWHSMDMDALTTHMVRQSSSYRLRMGSKRVPTASTVGQRIGASFADAIADFCETK